MRPSVRLLQIYLDKKRKAIKLRRKGQSYQEIAQLLKISKSTAYSWTRGIKLSKSAQARIEKKIEEALRKGLIAYNRVYAKIRSQEAAKARNTIKEKASKEIKRLSKRDLKLIGTALYWAEGNNKNIHRLQFSNSDPLMIKIVMKFFREICKISDDKITARIHLYPQTNHPKAINYWRKITDLSKAQFKKPQNQVSRASKRKRPNNTLPYGTIHLTVSSTKMACVVKGWIKGVSEKI